MQRIAFAEAKLLKERGHDVELIFIRKSKLWMGNYDEYQNVTILSQKGVENRFIGKFLDMLTLHYAPQRGVEGRVDADLILKFEIHRSAYDVLIYFDQMTSLFSLIGKIRHDGKTIIYVHETSLKDKGVFNKLVDFVGINLCDGIITQSQFNKKLLSRFRSKKLLMLYPGVDEVRVSHGFEERRNIALSVTLWDSGRHPEYFVDIARHFDFGRIILAGGWTDDSFRQLMTQRIKQEGIEDKLLITGPISEDVLNHLYQESKLFIRFGYNEAGPGMGSLEALSHGLPIIINSGIGIKEILKNGFNCEVVDEKNSIDVAIVMSNLMEDKRAWEFMSNNNLKLSKELSWHRHGQILDEFIRNI